MRGRTVTMVGMLLCILAGCETPGDVATAPPRSSVRAALPATFPAQQRPPGNPSLIARGEALYGIHCRACHGGDLRGGDMGGPNLLRSALVFNDQQGELIEPVVRQGRSTPGMNAMPPLALNDDDVRAVAEYLHAVMAQAQAQGAPPPGAEPAELNILVGDAAAGRQYFDRQCASCHSTAVDLRGIATRARTPENLQDSWVAGRLVARPVLAPGAPAPVAMNTRTNVAPPDPARRQVRATVTLRSGERIRGVLLRIDDFIVSIRTADGRYRSFPRAGSGAKVTAVEIDDPLRRHRELLSELTDATMHNVTAYLATLK
ncbi:MAG: c-type cytochrome [Gammaproteobacteria bacterium]|nr:c-type cytochrome [Gammaproteobacteria bacterium]